MPTESLIRTRERGGHWVVGQLALMAALAFFGIRFHHQWRLGLSAEAGSALLVLGGLYCLAGVLALGKHLTPYPESHPDSKLVQHGIYRLVRHPLYGGLMLTALGWALLRASWPALAAAVALALLLYAKARREEYWLKQQFPDYPEYARRVKRFIPFLW